MPIFTLSFWAVALENGLLAGSSAFLASIPATSAWNMNNLKIAGLAALTGVLYSFIKQLGAVQALTAATKVSLGKHVAGRKVQAADGEPVRWSGPS